MESVSAALGASGNYPREYCGVITRIYCRRCRNRKVILHRGWLKAYGRDCASKEIWDHVRQHFVFAHGVTDAR